MELVRHPKLVEAERLEAEISELGAQLAAATCRFLLLVAEFDRLDGWVGHRSCAHWLSWRCGLSASTAREHVRVAHALRECALIRETFAAARLSYSKVRAITRVVHPGNEAELVRTALVTTAAQLERIVRAMRTATRQQVRDRHSRRALTWRWDDDGMLVLSVRLDPDEGAVALAALHAAQSHDPHPEEDGVSPEETRAAEPAGASAEARPACHAAGSGRTSADSFSAIMTSYLGMTARDATDADAFQVVVLTDATDDGARDDGAPGGVTGDGIPIPGDTVARLACTAAVAHARVAMDGTPMDLGRKTRRVNASLRRALRIRDSGHCRFPGCTARRRLHAHHLRHWADGGETTLANLISLCPAHHWMVHEGGHHAWVDVSRRLRFARPDGRLLETAPRTGPVDTDLPADERIAPHTTVSDWDGTPLDLDNATLTLLQPAYNNPARHSAA